jgi:ATP-binding cassette subfamily B multidrug efflux pump
VANLRLILKYIRAHRFRLAVGIMCIVATSVCALAIPRVIGRAIDRAMNPGATTTTLLGYAAIILLISLVAGIFRFQMRWLIIGASRHIEFDFRNDFFGKLQSLAPSFYDKEKVGDLMARATNDIDAVRMGLGPGIMHLTSTLVVFPVALVQMLHINARLTLFALLPATLLPVLVNVVGNEVHRRFRRVQDHFSTISAMAQENLSGIRVVKAFVQESSQVAHFAGLNRTFIEKNMELARVQGAMFPALRFVGGMGMILILWLGGSMVIRKTISIGDLTAFSLLHLMLFWPMIALGWVVSLFQRAAASLERLQNVFDQFSDVGDTDVTRRSISEIQGSIEFRNLTFRYNPDSPVVLSHINLTIPRGKTIGIVGPIGSGKTTLVSLIARLYNAPPGMLFIDGIDINEIPLEVLRNHVSFVLQETFLFSDTITQNIAFGMASAEERTVAEAAEQAHIDREILGLPQGFSSMLGERGVNLSGGQKQRILVIDDALSSVDTETEAKILHNLGRFLRDRTAIIISHRISAVSFADEIIVLDGGEIVERGTHDELLALDGMYAELYRKQLLSDEIERESNGERAEAGHRTQNES